MANNEVLPAKDILDFYKSGVAYKTMADDPM